MKESKIKIARTFMPEILYPGTGLSPLTNKSVLPTNNVPSIQDIVDGKTTYKLPSAGGSWTEGEDINPSYKEEGDAYKRPEKYLDILRKMTNFSFGNPIDNLDVWIVKTDGGSKTFNSLQLAQEYKNKLESLGHKIQWMQKKPRLITAQSISKNDVITFSLFKTFKVIVRKVNATVESNGAAFCVAKNLFLTCAHVIQKYDKNKNEKINLYDANYNKTIYLTNGPNKYTAKVVAIDEINDIALLEANINVSPFGLQTDIKIGDEVLAIGSPHGFENNASFGYVTSLNRKIYKHKYAPDYIFIDANVFAGNSGGPIVNKNTGMVIGMVTAIVSASGEYGLNAGLPTKYLQDFCYKNKIYLT